MRSGLAHACLVGIVILEGCVSVPKDAGFGDVQRAVKEHTDQSIEWDRGAVETPVTDERVQSLLQSPLDADRTVQIALMNNHDLKATIEGLGVARAEYLQAFLPRNPIIDGEIRFPGRPTEPFEVSLMQTLIDLLKFKSRKKLSAATFAATQMRVSGAVINFAAEVRSNYYDLQAAQQVQARQRVVTEAARVSAELSGRQHTAGNISDLDLETEQALYEQAKLALARVELETLTARERLMIDMGLIDPATPWSMPEEFSPLPKSEPPREEIEAVALSRRVDIAVARQDLEAARKMLPLARTADFDELGIGVHHEREPEGTKTTGPAIALPIPIFNRGRAARARAVGLIRQNEQRLAALTVTARSEVRAAQERVIEARARTEYVRDVILPRRTRILYLTQLEYNAMLRGVFQLVQARQSLAEAEREYVLAQRDYWIARTELDTSVSGVARFSARPDEPRVARPSFSTTRTQQAGQRHE